MKEVAFVVPGDLATPTGGYAYDRRIITELEALGWRTRVLDIGGDFPQPSPDLRAAAHRRMSELSAACPMVIDGLAFGVLPQEARSLARTHRLVALVHHPLALESGLNANEADALRTSERAALAHARHVVVTSPTTARLLTTEFGVADDRLSIVRPGVDRIAPWPRLNDGRDGASREEGTLRNDCMMRDGTVSLLAVGSVVPRKGYDVLIAALARMPALPWRLVIAGDRVRNAATTRALDADIARHGFGERVICTGAIAPQRLMQLYAAADLFVLPSRFEGYGMAYAEAIAYGLPVVGTSAGAIADTVPAGAGVLVAPGDVDALTAVLRRLIENAPERARLAAGARAAAGSFPTWEDSAALFAHVLERLT